MADTSDIHLKGPENFAAKYTEEQIVQVFFLLLDLNNSYKNIEKITQVIQEGMDEGLFYEGDAEGIALGIFGVNFSSILYRIKRNRKVTEEQIYKSYIEIAIRGITKPQ